MKKIFLIFILTSLFLMAKAQAPHLFEHTYPAVSVEDPLIRNLMDKVSKDSLEATIEHMQSYHTRRWDSKMVYQVQDWLYNTYSDMGFDSVYLHDFPVNYHDSLWQTSDNVIAIQRGLVYPDEYVVCGAHYDSYNKTPGHPDSLRAPGADDNASGVAGIMETARILSHCRFERSIIYAYWAAEEIGLVGSAAYAKDCADQFMNVVGYFNLDMTGYLEEGFDIHVNLLYTTQDSLIANYVFDFSHTYYPEMRIWQDWLSGGDSDYSSFNRNGYPAVHPHEDTHHNSPFIHTTDDILGVSVNNLDQAKRFTELNVGLVATLAGLVSNGVDDVADNGLVIYPNPASDMITVKGIQIKEVEVYNVVGQRLLQQSFPDVEECQVEVGSLVSGIYFIKILGKEGEIFTAKFVKS